MVRCSLPCPFLWFWHRSGLLTPRLATFHRSTSRQFHRPATEVLCSRIRPRSCSGFFWSPNDSQPIPHPWLLLPTHHHNDRNGSPGQSTLHPVDSHLRSTIPIRGTLSSFRWAFVPRPTTRRRPPPSQQPPATRSHDPAKTRPQTIPPVASADGPPNQLLTAGDSGPSGLSS